MSRWVKDWVEEGFILHEKTPEEIEIRKKSVYNISEMRADVKRLNESLDIPVNSNNPNYNKKKEKEFLLKLPKNWKFCNWLDYVGK